jgi:hypothetical protein
VVLHHVADDAGGVVVGAAVALHPERLGDGDLHAVHVAVVEQRLEDRVAEAEREDVLHRLFPEVVVDAVDLALVEHLADVGGERDGALEIVAEGLLDDHPRPLRRVRWSDEAAGSAATMRGKSDGAVDR